MRLVRITLKRFRAYADETPIEIAPFSTFVGRNDSGKSSVLHALDVFFENRVAEQADLSIGSAANERIEITCNFDSLPGEVELESDVKTSLVAEKLVDSEGNLAIRRTFTPGGRKGSYETQLIVVDFSEEKYQNLCALTEGELNTIGGELELDFSRSGAGITNKDKREQLRQHAVNAGIGTAEIPIEADVKDRVVKMLKNLLPAYSMFAADWRLSEGETQFQSEFRELVTQAIESMAERTRIEEEAKKHIDSEVAAIFEFLRSHTSEVGSMEASPEFKWKNLVSFAIDTTDRFGNDVPLVLRGAGVRRLLMVAYFQYLASRSFSSGDDHQHIYGIEEPETYLHPGAQRELLKSLMSLTSQSQILITTHSPVFAGVVAKDGLSLVRRAAASVQVIQGDTLDADEVANDLGIEPADLIYGYAACIFVEGKDDVEFLTTVCDKLKQAGHVGFSFEDKQIGIVPIGGVDSLKWWVSKRALQNISKRFAVFIDSDRHAEGQQIKARRRNWKAACEDEGGIFHITRKREIENYLHPVAVEQHCGKSDSFDDFTAMKDKFGPNIIKAVEYMTADQILEQDAFSENGDERHELRDVVQSFLGMVS